MKAQPNGSQNRILSKYKNDPEAFISFIDQQDTVYTNLEEMLFLKLIFYLINTMDERGISNNNTANTISLIIFGKGEN